MICPKCDKDTLVVTHSYSAGQAGQTQRQECLICGCVVTSRTLIEAVDPGYGEGAYSLAERLKKARASGI